jgi:hypothetical protein
MPGRRLLLLAAVLLASGALAAALAPRDLRDPQAPTARTATTGTQASPTPRPGGREVRRVVDASAPRPALVGARVGDLVHLVVKAPEPDRVELVGLGRFEAVDGFSPARFDFFAERPGRFPIRLRESGEEIGRLDGRRG